MAITFGLLGVSYIFISMSNYKKDNKPNKLEVSEAGAKDMDIESKTLVAEDKKNQVSEAQLKDMDIEVRALVAEGMKIQAVKKYRMVTGAGLKEASDYIKSLSEENKN